MTKASWYFDFVSPFAYLQLARFDELPKSLEIVIKPVVFGALLQAHGQLGPAEIPSKRVYTYRFAHWLAHRRGVPFRTPPNHPFNPLAALRLTIAAGSTREAVEAIYGFIWGEGGDPQTPQGLDEMARRVGIEDASGAVSMQSVKERLRSNTQEAIEAGVFGVPTFIIDGELIWGDDGTQMVADYIAEPGLFKTEEMRRISTMPMGLTRVR